MPKKSLKISEEEISMTLDLKNIFGKTVPDRTLRSVIADDIKDYIIKRTLKGYGVDEGRPIKFVPYSPAYVKFKGQTNVDLELSGSMLNSILPLDLSDAERITIGIANKDAPKAHGHTTGQYGKGPLPKRPFLDLTDNEINLFKKQYQDDVDKIQRKSVADYITQIGVNIATTQLQNAVENLIKGKK